MAKNNNYRGWHGNNVNDVFDRVGNRVSLSEAEAFLKWKAENKAGPSSRDKFAASYEKKLLKRRADTETNRFRRKSQRFIAGNTERTWNVPEKYSKYFHESAFRRNRAGQSPEWSRQLTLSEGKNANYNWGRREYRNTKAKEVFGYNSRGKQIRIGGKTKRTGADSLWGSALKKGGAYNLKDIKQMVKQILIAERNVALYAEHFRVLVGERAIQVFRNSFKYHKFYTNNSDTWHPLAEYTLRKRAKKGTGSQILVEYGDLRDSFELEKEADPMTTRVTTGIVKPSEVNRKKYPICYAGWHNEGEGTYGNGWGRRRPKQYIKRQFMGHSTYLDPMTDGFLRKMLKTYLFDSVFQIPK